MSTLTLESVLCPAVWCTLTSLPCPVTHLNSFNRSHTDLGPERSSGCNSGDISSQLWLYLLIFTVVSHGGPSPALQPQTSLLSAPFPSLVPVWMRLWVRFQGLPCLLFHSGVSAFLFHLSPSWLHTCANPAPGLRTVAACR